MKQLLLNVDCYGRLALQAGSGHHVTALIGRTTDGLRKAMAASDTSFARIKSGGFVPWTASAGEMTLLHAQWVASVTWQWATILTDAAVLNEQGNDISDVAYSLVLKYCADAADQSVKSMQMANALLHHGKRPANTAILPPKLHINVALLEPTWALVEATAGRIFADLALIRRLGIPERFKFVYTAIEKALQPIASVYEYYQDQWRVSPDVASRREILKDATKLIPDLYKIGQQIWAPYLLGSLFVDVLRSSAVFDKYNLGIDPWVITNPTEATKRSNDKESCIAVAEFWKTMADPRSVVALQELINEAIDLGTVKRVEGSTYRIAPWHDQYQALEPITLGTLQLDKGALFAINIRGPQGQRTAEIRKTGSAA